MAGEDTILGTGRTGGRDATAGVIPGRFALAVGNPETATPPGWKWTALSEVAQLESGHTPSRKCPEYWDGGVPWIGIKDAVENHGRTIWDTFQHVSELGLENSSARLLPANTVCLSRTASVGFVVVMGRPMATSQDFVNWACGPNIDPQFLKYVLLAENEALWRFASGTTHQTIYYPEAKAFHVCLPPLHEQNAIAQILGCFDEKIELNRQMNMTLEATTRALFQSWFVDFDPVRAKVDGQRPLGIAPAVSALFPNGFEGSGMGAIPRGWSIDGLESIASVTMGLSPNGDSYNSEGKGLPLINGPVEFGDYFPVKTKWTETVTRRTQKDDLIFCVRGSTTGRRVISDDEYCIGRGVCSIRAKNGWRGFLYLTIDHGLERLLSKTTGSVFPSLSAPDIKNFPILKPIHAVIDAFEQSIDPLIQRIAQNHHQNRVLSNLRETLLPELLSGRTRVGSVHRYNP